MVNIYHSMLRVVKHLTGKINHDLKTHVRIMPVMGEKLKEFIRAQYGKERGKRWDNITAMSYDVGDNQEVVPRMERKGTATVPILRKLAVVTGYPLIDILVWAGVLKEEEVPATEKRKLTEEEWQLVRDFREM